MPIEMNGRTLAVASLIVLGIFFEALKIWSPSRLASLEDRILDSRPYAISERTIHNLKHGFESHFAPSVVTKSTPFDLAGTLDKWQKDQDKLTAEEKKKQGAVKGWHWAWNSKTQKWVWKKKPKKKKATEVAADSSSSNGAASSTASNSSSATSAPAPVSALGSPQPVTPAPSTGAAASSAPSRFLTAQEWESLLLTSPNTTETKYFVQQYQDHFVTPTTFYQVVNMMLKSSQSGVQQDGLLALSLTPSAQSFADLAAEQQTLQTSSPLYQTTTQDLNQYSQLQNVSILKQVLSSSQTVSVLTEGETELQQSIQTNLAGTTGNPSTQGGTNTQVFAAFVPILNTLKSNPNQSVASLANTLLGTLGGTVAFQASLRK